MFGGCQRVISSLLFSFFYAKMAEHCVHHTVELEMEHGPNSLYGFKSQGNR